MWIARLRRQPIVVQAIWAGLAIAFVAALVEARWSLAFVSVATFAALRPLAHKISTSAPQSNVGAHRQVGQRARVLEAIDGEHDYGLVQLDREKWRAESMTGQPIAVGTIVTVIEVRGTRVVVAPTDPDVPADTPSEPT